MALPVEWFVVGSALLFLIGLYGLLTKHEMIRLAIAIEILTCAANLNFVALSAYRAVGSVDPLAHAFAIISIAVGACVVAVALALILHAYRIYRTTDVRELKRLRW